MGIFSKLFKYEEPIIPKRIIEGQPNQVRLIIPIKVYLKLKYYIKHASGEIGGIGIITKKDMNFIIDDIFLLKQNATGGNFELDNGELARFVADISRTNPEYLPKMKMWWHSHVNMGTFWSGEDNSTFIRLLRHNHELDYFVGIVGNKKMELRGRIDVESNIGTIRFDNLKVIVKLDDKQIEDSITKEVRSKVRNGYLAADPESWIGI